MWSDHLELDHKLGPEWQSETCPLCLEPTGIGKSAVLIHFARHMEDIALAALPHETESEDGSEENSETNSDDNFTTAAPGSLSPKAPSESSPESAHDFLSKDTTVLSRPSTVVNPQVPSRVLDSSVGPAPSGRAAIHTPTHLHSIIDTSDANRVLQCRFCSLVYEPLSMQRAHDEWRTTPGQSPATLSDMIRDIPEVQKSHYSNWIKQHQHDITLHKNDRLVNRYISTFHSNKQKRLVEEDQPPNNRLTHHPTEDSSYEFPNLYFISIYVGTNETRNNTVWYTEGIARILGIEGPAQQTHVPALTGKNTMWYLPSREEEYAERKDDSKSKIYREKVKTEKSASDCNSTVRHSMDLTRMVEESYNIEGTRYRCNS
jgi:hypothetical protein